MRNYRLFFFGHLVSSTGTWMQQVGQDWLVLRLTNAALPVGITLALQFAPMLAFGAWAGVIADRLEAWKACGVTTLIVQSHDPETLRVMAELLL